MRFCEVGCLHGDEDYGLGDVEALLIVADEAAPGVAPRLSVISAIRPRLRSIGGIAFLEKLTRG